MTQHERASFNQGFVCNLGNVFKLQEKLNYISLKKVE